MEKTIPFHGPFRLGKGIDFTNKLPNTKDDPVQGAAYDTKEVNSTRSRCSLVKSAKDVSEIFEIPIEYALKVATGLFENDIVKESMSDVFNQNCATFVFRINFLHKILSTPTIRRKFGRDSHAVKAFQIGNELVVILKITASDPETLDSLTAELQDICSFSDGNIDEKILQKLMEYAEPIDEINALKKQDANATIHYGTYRPLDAYPSDLAGMVNTIRCFIQNCHRLKGVFSAGASSSPNVRYMAKKSINHEKMQTPAVKKEEQASHSKEVVFMRAVVVEYKDTESDSEIETSEPAFHQYSELDATKLNLLHKFVTNGRKTDLHTKSFRKPDDAEGNARRRRHDHYAARYMSRKNEDELEEILERVSKLKSEVYQTIEALDMTQMPTERHIMNISIIDPVIVVTDFIKKVSPKLPKGEPLDLLLIGKTGHGKSSTGNSILGKNKFKASHSADSVTKESSSYSSTQNGRIISIVDTPGVFDTGALDDKKNREEATAHLTKAVQLCPTGYDALLIVIPFGHRMTKEEIDSIYLLKKIFGENMIKDHCVCIITRGDQFDQVVEQDMTFEKWCLEAQNFLGELFKECEYRCVLFDNRCTDDLMITKGQLVDLVSQVDKLKAKGKRYKLEIFEKAKAKREELEAEMGVVGQDVYRDTQLVIDQVQNIEQNKQSETFLDELKLMTGLVEKLYAKVAQLEGEQALRLAELSNELATKSRKMDADYSNYPDAKMADALCETLKTHTESLHKMYDSSMKPKEENLLQKGASFVANGIGYLLGWQ